MRRVSLFAIATLGGMFLGQTVLANDMNIVAEPGHPSLQAFRLPDTPPAPANNAPTPARVELGKKLFFDPRLSGNGTISCATCHNPTLGWSDGLPKGIGINGSVLPRATPTVINAAYNHIQMWDGRKRDLEDQAMGPMEADKEMNADIDAVIRWLNENEGYRQLFARAYPGEPIDTDTLSRAIASFERTVISKDSPFDRWARGDRQAMTEKQVRGFRLFIGKAECVKCHSGPNFTDDGFHNVGLASFGDPEPDTGRYKQVPLRLMKGAFKTPTLRDVTRTAPYFHDGSAATLEEVVRHYNRGGEVKTNLDPNIRPLNLTDEEVADLVAFMEALTSPFIEVALPELPR